MELYLPCDALCGLFISPLWFFFLYFFSDFASSCDLSACKSVYLFICKCFLCFSIGIFCCLFNFFCPIPVFIFNLNFSFLDVCFLMRLSKKTCVVRWRGGENLGVVEGGETIIKIHCRKTSIFNKK